MGSREVWFHPLTGEFYVVLFWRSMMNYQGIEEAG